MEIHRFERLWLGLSTLLVVGIVATVVYGAVGPGVEMVDASGGTIDNANLEGTEFEDPGVRQVGEDEYEVYVVARQFYFQPGTSSPIQVPAGSTVTFHVTSADVIHGFHIAETNVNTMVIPGQDATLTAEFDEAGEYGIVCHEYCGSGHHSMEGKIEVVPQSQFDASEGDS
jgi:cytochrome c oxidase subunit 2